MRQETAIFWALSFVFGLWMVLHYRHTWYLLADDWTILGSRMEHLELYGFDDFLLRRHNEHLMGGMVLWNVGLAEIFGLRSYTPWIISVQLANVFVAWTLRCSMTRIGVNRIVAAICAPLFLVWGPFSSIAAWAPEAIFPISLSCIIVQFGLSSDDSPRMTRTVLGSFLGMTGVFLHSACVVVVPLVVLWLALRRRWMKAVIASAPLLLYGLWYITYQTRDPSYRYFDPLSPGVPSNLSLGLILEFSAKIVSRIALPNSSIFGFTLVVSLVAIGAKVAIRANQKSRETVALAFTVSAMYLLAFTWARGFVTDVIYKMDPPARYAAVVALPIIPLAVLGGQRIAVRLTKFLRIRTRTAVVIALLSIPPLLFVQLSQRNDYDKDLTPFTTFNRSRVFEVADHPEEFSADQQEFVFEGNWLTDLTIGDIARFRRLGWL